MMEESGHEDVGSGQKSDAPTPGQRSPVSSATPSREVSPMNPTTESPAAPPVGGFVPLPGVVASHPSKVYAGMDQAATNLHMMPPEPSVIHPRTDETVQSDPTLSSYVMVGAPPPASGYESVGLAVGQPEQSESHDKSESLFGWLSGGGLVNKVLEKTKSSVESMITTLDPGMTAVIRSGGDIDIIVASTKDVKVSAVRKAFQEVFGHATVTGRESQPSIAPQPIGYSSGLKGAQERAQTLRQSGGVHEKQAIVSVENFLVELHPDSWYDMGCVYLKDPLYNIELQTFTQATPVALDYVTAAQDQTPADYDLRWSGLSVTVGQIIEQRHPQISRSDWHYALTGVSRHEMIYVAAKCLAGLYRHQLPVTH